MKKEKLNDVETSQLEEKYAALYSLTKEIKSTLEDLKKLLAEQKTLCNAYGTKAQGIGSESITAFGNAEEIACEDSGSSDSTNSVASKKKSARFFLTNIFKKWTQLVFSRFDSRWHIKTPCSKCIKRSGICQPHCKKRRRA